METVWSDIKKNIQKQIPDQSYRLWLEPLVFGGADDYKIYLKTPNYFSMKRVQQTYGALIKDEFKRATGKDYTLNIDAARPKTRQLKPEHKPNIRLPKQQLLPDVGCQGINRGRMLRKDYTFDSFVVGNNNDFAYSAAQSMASTESIHTNSLFLLSDTGMGKSHLTQALGHRIIAERPSEKVYYITAEDFTNEMVGSFRNKRIDAFKDKYRNNCDVLLLEDIHFLSGKEKTQAELAMTLDYLFESGKKIMFSSCYLPGEIPKMSNQLKSRFASGLVSSMEPPDFRTRVRILQKKAKSHGLAVPPDVLEYLSGELTDNIRQLESGLNGVATRASLMCLPMNLELAERVVKNIASTMPTITVGTIKKLVCREYNICVSDIESKSRKQTVVKPRQMAMYLSRRYTDQPLQSIGKSFKRYHATVMHSISAVEKEMKANTAIKKQVEYLSRKLEKFDF